MEHLLKYPLEKKLTVTVTSGEKKGGEYASPTNPDKGCAGKCKKKIQTILAMRPPEKKIYAFCMDPDTPQKSVKY